ncbi:MAG: ribonuclease [Saprospiraceae bacterium]|nr:ribonuclease [Saprospiraceae bacterium]
MEAYKARWNVEAAALLGPNPFISSWFKLGRVSGKLSSAPVEEVIERGADDALKLMGKAAEALTSFDDVAKYVSINRKLPSNYITKEQAKALGWKPNLGNLDNVAPSKSIGGDIFKNLEGLLPQAKGRIWYEADINYSGGFRGGERLLYSNDGLVYKTLDHYKTFTQLK